MCSCVGGVLLMIYYATVELQYSNGLWSEVTFKGEESVVDTWLSAMLARGCIYVQRGGFKP
jgi:hypothetical protein